MENKSRDENKYSSKVEKEKESSELDWLLLCPTPVRGLSFYYSSFSSSCPLLDIEYGMFLAARGGQLYSHNSKATIA